MKKISLLLPWLLVLAAAAIVRDAVPPGSSFLIRDAFAEDQCTPWTIQSNGCYFRTCVDNGGHQYCLQACGKNVSRVSCR